MDEVPDEAEPWLPLHLWEVATDPSLPSDVIEFVHPDGRRFRYPLVEFMVDE